MQTADIMLSLAGDVGNSVPKQGVTPAEVAVLRFIHGNDAVTITKVDDNEFKRSHQQEKARLLQIYGRPNPDLQGRMTCEALDQLFPGVAAPVYQKFDELPDMEEPDAETFDEDLDQHRDEQAEDDDAEDAEDDDKPVKAEAPRRAARGKAATETRPNDVSKLAELRKAEDKIDAKDDTKSGKSIFED